MKNNLNSLILEGKVVSVEKKQDYVVGVISSMAKGIKKKFTILANGKIGDCFYQYGTKNRGIRLVGSLDNDNGNTVIFAEHIEYKPVFSEPKNE